MTLQDEPSNNTEIVRVFKDQTIRTIDSRQTVVRVKKDTATIEEYICKRLIY